MKEKYKKMSDKVVPHKVTFGDFFQSLEIENNLFLTYQEIMS